MMGRWLQSAAGLALAAALFGLHSVARADDLPTEPILRINPPGHTGKIDRIAVDKDERFAVTASYDKTVRLWSLPDGKPLKVIRLPSGEGDLGKAYAVALSPDGRTIATGGWTGPVGQPKNIFLFDRASGSLVKRLPGLPNVIDHLAFSPDGKRLAAALSGSNGIRVFDAAVGYRPLASDTDYGADSYSVDFDAANRLVSASFDGFVRLYAPDHYDNPALPKARVTGIARPKSVAFSPDGTRIAVSDQDSPRIAILSAQDLKPAILPDVSGFSENSAAFAWSRDGHFLYAGGIPPIGNSPVRRWAGAGAGNFRDIQLPRSALMQLKPLTGERLLALDSDGFSLINDSGKASRLQDTAGIVPRGPLPKLKISPDARVVQIDDSHLGKAFRFELDRRTVTGYPPGDNSLRGAITASDRILVSHWEDETAPKVNGNSLELYENETSRSVALVPGADRFVLGADWSIRMFDAHGKPVWPARPVPDTTWDVNVSADGKLIVAAYGDGTIRWHRASDGAELLALFIDPATLRWVAWTPQGYYDASAGADDLIGWQVNHGYDQAPDFFPASQFQDRFNRRDVIARVLDTGDIDAALAEADRAAGRSTVKAAPVTVAALKPVVQIRDPLEGATQTTQELSVTYSARMTTSDPIIRVEAKIDGAAVKAVDRELLTEGATRVGKLSLTMPRHDSIISVIAYNANGASEPAKIAVHWGGPGLEKKPTLYVLSIGVTDYREPSLRTLKYPAKDARDFVALAKAEAGGLYDHVVFYPKHESLADGDADRDTILDGLDWIEHAVESSNDVAMIFLSGHGVSTPDQHYRFLPYNYDPQRLERTTIKDTDLQDYIAHIGGKTIFFFDTCYSGGILGFKAGSTNADVDRFANQLSAAQNGVVVFASSSGNELSREDDRWKNGAFTKALLDGVHGAAARSNSGVISIADLEGYIARAVFEMTGGNQHPTTAKPKTVPDYPIVSVVH